MVSFKNAFSLSLTHIYTYLTHNIFAANKPPTNLLSLPVTRLRRSKVLAGQALQQEEDGGLWLVIYRNPGGYNSVHNDLVRNDASLESINRIPDLLTSFGHLLVYQYNMKQLTRGCCELEHLSLFVTSTYSTSTFANPHHFLHLNIAYY